MGLGVLSAKDRGPLNTEGTKAQYFEMDQK